MHICLTLIFLFSNTGSSVLEQYFFPRRTLHHCCVSLFEIAFRINSLSATGIYHFTFCCFCCCLFNTYFRERKIAKHALVFGGKGTEEEASGKRKVFTEDIKELTDVE